MLIKMDKIILIAYVHFNPIVPADTTIHYFTKVRHHIEEQLDLDQTTLVAVPDYNYDGKGMKVDIECVNPKLVSEQEYDKATAIVDKLQKASEEFISRLAAV